MQQAVDAKLDTLPEIEQFMVDGISERRLVFVNGSFAPTLSSVPEAPEGFVVSSIGELVAEKGLAKSPARQSLDNHLARYASYNDQSFVALNTAFLRDGAFVRIEKGVVAEQPLHLLFVTAAAEEEIISHPRVLIVAEENSRSSVIESHVSLDNNTYFTGAVTEVAVGENAFVDHCKIQLESEQANHISTLHAVQQRGSNFCSHLYTFGGLLVRNELTAVLEGGGCETSLNGLSVVNGSQHVDNHTVLDHVEPHCNSNELFKSILGESAKGVFDGTIIVRPGAQKTNAIQSNSSLLLSRDASSNSKPQLKIWADDVKCTHGATAGEIDENAMFYLRSRGIAEKEARRILIHAYAKDITAQLKSSILQKHLEDLLQTKLGRML